MFVLPDLPGIFYLLLALSLAAKDLFLCYIQQFYPIVTKLITYLKCLQQGILWREYLSGTFRKVKNLKIVT